MVNRAFTLIELLVVIAIAAILTAILFPVFVQATDAAEDAANLGNLKHVALATIEYGIDSDAVQGGAVTYTACDGSAKRSDLRGKIYKTRAGGNSQVIYPIYGGATD